jgi:D-3-phosphoglycerate dehydrogenase/(S)-sulfolactate dehydrogenase
MPTVLVLANILHKKTGAFADALTKAGFEIRFPEHGYRQLTEKELAKELPGAVATIAGSEPYTAEIIEANPQLRVISRTGVGTDAIDRVTASRARVAVCTTPGVNQDSVAEQAFALLLAVSRFVLENHAMVAGGGFTRKLPAAVRGRTLGLVGFGRTGRAMAKRAQAFDMKVLAFDPLSQEQIPGVSFVPLDEVLTQSDFVSLHAPLTSDTHRMINAETIARMKRGVRIINTARGPLMDENALVDALKSGHVAGAGLDVFAEEPPKGSPLLDAPNVVFSPHVAGVDIDAADAMGLMAAETIAALYRGEFPRERIVNASELEPWRW